MDARSARRTLVVAVAAGLLAELVLDRQPLGISMPLSVAIVLGIVTWSAPAHRPADRLDWWLAGTALVASLGPALRTDPTVVFLDLVLVIVATGAWAVALSGVAVTRRSAEAVIALAFKAAGAMAAAPLSLLRRAVGEQTARTFLGRLGRLAPVARGIVLAVPVVAGFALLLGSADAVFGHALGDAFRFSFDIDDVVGRSAFIVFAALLVAGPAAVAGGIAGWAGAPLGAPEAGPASEAGDARAGEAAGARAGTTETLIVLGAVDALFAAFAAIQVVFLFGGTDTLTAIGMTYSDYARQGYFQLVGVVALAGLLVMGAHHVVGRTRAFLVAALVLLVLTGLILVSAAVRLALYQGAYGWTELRFFVAASIAWLGIAVVAAITLLAVTRMRWLPHALAMSAVAVTVAVSAIGPQAFVIQENVARVLDPSRVAAGGHAGLDLEYGMTLGDDAIPTLVAAVDALPGAEGTALRRRLGLRYEELLMEARTAGPLTWNLARQRATDALARLFADED